MVAMTTLLTADEYLATGDERPHFTELINGEAVVNTPNIRHQRIASELQFLLQKWTKAVPERGESPHSFDTRLDTGNVYAPHVWWVSEEHRPAHDATHLDGPPDLAVEVLSPSTWRFDIGTKREAYERSGLRELWLVDTSSNSILVFRRSAPEVAVFDIALELAGGETLESPQLPGFRLDVTALFDR
jgi:Uma2 family endonuclease